MSAWLVFDASAEVAVVGVFASSSDQRSSGVAVARAFRPGDRPSGGHDAFVAANTSPGADAVLRAERSSSVRGAHGEALLVLIDEVLREASIPLAALTGIVVGRGPGSFTGIRVALATALGLRRACPSLPIATVTTFEALAHGHEGTFVVTVPALPGEVYAERWQDGAPLGEPTVLAEDTLTPGEKRVQATLDLRSLWRASRGKPASAELLPCYVAPPKITAPK